MRTKKQEGFDYQNFEKEALRALYEGKPLEEALGPLLKRIVEAGLQGGMQAHLSASPKQYSSKVEKTTIFEPLCEKVPSPSPRLFRS